MWNVSLDQAIEMYARCCRAWYGARAIEVVALKVSEQRDAENKEGEHVWTKVQRVLESQSTYQATDTKDDRAA